MGLGTVVFISATFRRNSQAQSQPIFGIGHNDNMSAPGGWRILSPQIPPVRGHATSTLPRSPERRPGRVFANSKYGKAERPRGIKGQGPWHCKRGGYHKSPGAGGNARAQAREATQESKHGRQHKSPGGGLTQEPRRGGQAQEPRRGASARAQARRQRESQARLLRGLELSETGKTAAIMWSFMKWPPPMGLSTSRSITNPIFL